ncbi:MAG TPA: hypothetical protein VHF58_10940 [Solirubrobacterales bacterium]|nr:hypothetical protein [Solirubrobacterales bacterium]
MSLGLKIYAAVGTAILVLCLALVVAMVVDSQTQPRGAAQVLSGIDSSTRAD